MLDIMFDVPSRPNIKEVVIDEDVIKLGKPPKLVMRTEAEMEAHEGKDSKKDPKDSAESA